MFSWKLVKSCQTCIYKKHWHAYCTQLQSILKTKRDLLKWGYSKESLCSQNFCPSNEEEKKKQKQNIIIACKLMQINTMIQTTERRGVKM